MNEPEVLNPMTKTECREWIAALRSGKYRQTTGTLRERVGHNADFKSLKSPYTGYCCLGVEQKIHPEQCAPITSVTMLKRRGDDAVRLSFFNQKRLLGLNDDSRWSFKRIADHIEISILPNLAD